MNWIALIKTIAVFVAIAVYTCIWMYSIRAGIVVTGIIFAALFGILIYDAFKNGVT